MNNTEPKAEEYYDVDTLEFEIMNAKTDKYRHECLEELKRSRLQAIAEEVDRLGTYHYPNPGNYISGGSLVINKKEVLEIITKHLDQ